MTREQAIQRTQHWFDAYYHSPCDDLNQDIDFEAIARYTNFMFIFINRLLNEQKDPEWFSDSPYQRTQKVP